MIRLQTDISFYLAFFLPALDRFKAGIAFANDKHPTVSPYNLTVPVTLFGRGQ